MWINHAVLAVTSVESLLGFAESYDSAIHMYIYIPIAYTHIFIII